MNERIKQITALAEELTDGVHHKLVIQNVPNLSWVNIYSETLVALVVRECARIAIQNQTERDMDNIVSDNPAHDFAQALINHFGVK